MRSGENRIVVDFDGTCVEDNQWPKMGDWLPDAVNGLGTLLKSYEVVIHSTSTAPFQPDEKTPADPSKRIQAIRAKLDEAGLHEVKIWDRPWKPGARFYIENKAIPYRGDWYEVLREVKRG